MDRDKILLELMNVYREGNWEDVAGRVVQMIEEAVAREREAIHEWVEERTAENGDPACEWWEVREYACPQASEVKNG